MIESLKNFANFYKNPNTDFKWRKKDIFFLFLFFFTLSVFYSAFILDPISSSFDIWPNSNEEAVKNINWILLIIIWAPIVEELIFRLPFRKQFQDIFFYISSFLWLFIFWLNFLPLTIIFVIFWIYWKEFYEKYFKYIIWIIPIYFWLIHIINYEVNATNIFLAPLLLMPQIIIGWVLGYIRLINWIISAIIFHSLYNSSIILLWFNFG